MSETKLEVVIERLKGLDALINEKFKQNEKQHESLLTHQKLTNGRVNKLEDKSSLCENWQSKAIGVFLAINILFLPLIFILINKFL